MCSRGRKSSTYAVAGAITIAVTGAVAIARGVAVSCRIAVAITTVAGDGTEDLADGIAGATVAGRGGCGWSCEGCGVEGGERGGGEGEEEGGEDAGGAHGRKVVVVKES